MRTYSRAEDETFNHPVVYIGKMYKLKQSVGEIDAIRPLEKSQEVCKKNKQTNKQTERKRNDKTEPNQTTRKQGREIRATKIGDMTRFLPTSFPGFFSAEGRMGWYFAKTSESVSQA